jgi:hypothetical protein
MFGRYDDDYGPKPEEYVFPSTEAMELERIRKELERINARLDDQHRSSRGTIKQSRKPK